MTATIYSGSLNLGSLDYSADVQARIRPNQMKFEMDCHVGAYPFRSLIPLSVFDLNHLAHGLQAGLEALREVFDDDASSGDEREQALLNLALKGRAAFLLIFGSGGLNDRLTKTLLTEKVLIFQVTSEEFSIPWDALYLRDPAQPISCDWFLGMRHIVSRIVVLPDGSDIPVDHLIKAKRPAMGLLSNMELDVLMEREMPFFKKQAKEKIITLNHLEKELDASDRKQFIHLRRFLNRRYDILHFACHADFVQGVGPKFVITRDFDVSLEDLISYECKVQGNPVVFLNACRTSDVEPIYFCGLAKHFMGKGARALIATECEIPDGFAAEFSEFVYSQFLKHKPLGECVFAAKRHFLKRGNPIGLAYSYYGPPSIRINQ